MARKLRNGLLALLVLLGALWLALEFAARATARQFARALDPVAVLEYDSAGLGWNGRLRLDAPRVHFGSGSAAPTLTADTAHVAAGGWLWMLRGYLPGADPLPAEAVLELHGSGVANMPLAAALGEWLQGPGPVPFATEGCEGAAPTVAEYARLGIHGGTRVDRIDYRFDADRDRFELAFEIARPDFARLTGSADFSAFRPAVFSDARARAELRLARAELAYHDEGFLGVRNAVCAGRVKTSTSSFIDAHMAAVDRFLAGRGIRASDDLRELYRRLVTEGGTLRLTTLPDPGWVPAAIAEYPRADLLRQLSVTARLGDALPLMLQLDFADPVAPLTLAVPMPAAAPAETLATPALPVAAATEATTPEAPTPAAVPSSADAAANAAANGVSAALAAPAEGRVEEGAAASADTPAKGSTLALVWKPGVIERLPPRAQERPDYEVIAIDALSGHLGRRLRLVTAGGRIVDGELLGVEAGHARIDVRIGAGRAVVAVPLANVDEARLVVGRR